MTSRKPKTLGYSKEITSGSVGSILAKLYGKIRHDLGISASRYDALMQRYINKALVNPSKQDKAAARAGLSKELLKEEITLKTFVKGIEFHGCPRFDIGVTLYHANGQQTHHSIGVILDELDSERELPEEVKKDKNE